MSVENINLSKTMRRDRALEEAKRLSYNRGIMDAVAMLRRESPIKSEFLSTRIERSLYKEE